MELKYNVYKIKTRFLSMINYCYIVVDKESKSALVVDPSWEIDKILEKLDEQDANLTTILLTHSHYDHTNKVNALVDRFNANVYMSQKEIDCYGFTSRNLHGLNDLDEIKINKTKVSCLLTQGHTAGGMCYLLQGCMFTGDTIFAEGCGFCEGQGAAEQMYESIQKVKQLVSNDVIVYPGHSYGVEPGKTFGHLKMINIYLGIEDKNKFVNYRMRKNQKGLLNFK